MIRTWRLDASGQTMVLASREGALAEVVYWSALLGQQVDPDAIALAHVSAPGGGMLDVVAPVTLCPEEAAGFPGHPGLIAEDENGSALRPGFEFCKEARDGPNLTLTFEDARLGLIYEFLAKADPMLGVIRLQARLKSTSPITLHWFAAPVLPAPQLCDEIITFTGRWTGEFQLNRVPWVQGAHMATAPGGRTSHERQPGIVIPERGATETRGGAYGLHLGWSGGHRLIAEELPSGARHVQFGATGKAKGTNFETPPLYAAFSGLGMNGVSQSFHDYLRREILTYANPKRPRPVHYNCWEAVYFDHQPDVLMDLARRAADLGVERFVLDDGWFGARDDDTSSLGDWTVDRRKWPNGLQPLINHVTTLGMGFGIWFEPEMINPESALFKAHPDWVLGPADQPTGRHQLVLDLSRPEVTAYLFDVISTVLTEYPGIEYIKWDHNRVLPHAAQGQTQALYALLDRIRAAHTMVEIESCASGGGRIDFGILERTQRVWLSDSNDAGARWKIQRGASYFFPPEITGSHIGPRICHTSGRQFPMSFKAAVAGSRAMGLEMDLRELTEEEAGGIRTAIERFKEHRHILHGGSHFRLESADPNVSAEMHMRDDGGEFILLCAQLQPSAQQLARPLRLAGLDMDAAYRLELLNTSDIAEVMNRNSSNPLALGAPVTLNADVLMYHGVLLPNAFPDTIWTVKGTRL